MQRLEQDVGFEMLSHASRVKVSRFTRRIRLLHWYNAASIICLYALGISQLFELSGMGLYVLQDLRPIHFKLGIAWLIGVLILTVIARVKPAHQRDVISTDKLVVKQRIFLYASSIIMTLMALTGLAMYLLRGINVPEVRSILLTLHGLIAFSYLPVLSFHIYLALLQRDSRQSLRTMITDVRLKYLIHNHIPNLRCLLTDNEGVLLIQGCINEISLIGFHVKIKKGQWQQQVSLNNLNYVELLHPDLDQALRLKVRVINSHPSQGELRAEVKFRTSLQVTAEALLSRALFFRALFLARRTHPRLSCNLPVEIEYDGKPLVGLVVDFCKGGMGFVVPVNLKKGCLIQVKIKLINPGLSLNVSGKILVKETITANDWCYGLSFSKLDRSQKKQILEVLMHLRIQRRLKELNAKN